MDSAMERQSLLDKYLQDKLTEAELLAFNAFLESDPEFKEEVAFQTDVKRAVIAEEDENFKDMLSGFDSEAQATASKTTEHKTEKTKTFPNKWLVAASVALMAGLGYFYSISQTTDPKDLFVENFTPYRNVTHPITRGEAVTDTKTKAFLAYSKTAYKEAIPLFTELYTVSKEPYYLFYKANALIQLNRGEEAIPLLKEHLATTDALTDKSNWYLAMAYLQLEDTENAKKALNEVVSKKTYKAEQAKQLLDVL